MTTVTQRDVDGIAKSAQRLLDKIESMSQEDAKTFCQDILIQIGALDHEGNVKEQIVTGDFFGWQ